MMIHMVIKKNKSAFTLSEKKNPVFQPVEKKYLGFPAEEKKKTVSSKITQAPPRNSNGLSLKSWNLGLFNILSRQRKKELVSLCRLF